MGNPEELHTFINEYLEYVALQRRYSDRTVDLYQAALNRFQKYAGGSTDALNPSILRSFEVHLMDEEHLSPRTVNLHLSVLSGFCRYLVKKGIIQTNPVRMVTHPKSSKRLPVFFREETMEQYFKDKAYYASPEALQIMRQHPVEHLYSSMLSRIIVSLLFATGLRRSELISLTPSSFDASRGTLTVRGKGDKMRQVPLTKAMVEELSHFLEAAESFFGAEGASLLRTPNGGALYPVYVDRVIKAEMGGVSGVTGRKSPHVLRHTIATELLDGGAELNSIKEFLGHSSLAATQVYTHSSIERLQSVYKQAHPRSKGK